MGGPDLALLLLYLLSRVLLPGLAQDAVTVADVVTGTDVDLRSQSPAAASVSPLVTSADPASSIASGSGLVSIVPGGQESATIGVIDPSADQTSPATTAAESSTGAAITRALQDLATDSPTTSNTETTGPILAQPPPTTHSPTRSVTEDVTTGPLSSLTEGPHGPHTPRLSTEAPPDATRPTTEALTSWTPAILTRPHTTRAHLHRGPSVQELGDNQEVPGFHAGNSSNPLFVMIVSVFTIVVVMVVVVIGYHRYKKRNRRTEFRRLQDLPMDDMMEDTPLSLYSY